MLGDATASKKYAQKILIFVFVSVEWYGDVLQLLLGKPNSQVYYVHEALQTTHENETCFGKKKYNVGQEK